MKPRHYSATVVVVAIATYSLGFTFANPAAAQGSPSGDNVAVGPTTTQPVELSSGAKDVLKLSRAKLSDDVTVAFIQNGNRQFNLTASEILYLRTEGVSDRVLTAMLGQPSQVAAAAPAPAAPATIPEASAPQYTTPPATNVLLETAPVASTYLVPSTPTYYSFYNSSPYWYDPWPYWYPALSLGLYWGWGWAWGWGWGNCGYWGYPYCHNGYWNNYWHNGYYAPYAPYGNRPPPPNGALVSGGTPTAGANSTAVRNGANRIESRSASVGSSSGRPTSYWNNSGSQTAAARPINSQASADSSRSSLTATSTGRSANSDNVRAARTVENRSAAPVSGTGRSAGSTSVWNGSGNQRPTAPRVLNQTPTAASSAGRISAAPSTTLSRSSAPSSTRYVASPRASYQGSAMSSGYSYRPSGSVGSISRPSMNPSFGSMGSSSGFRSGGGFGGGGSRMSNGGGGFSGGGGRSR